jgi:DNA invertase Pin-like site-specific DNA recombinase
VRVALYIRVSTADQNIDLQRRELSGYAERQAWEIIEAYEDTISGAKTTRPALNRLLSDARAIKSNAF